MFAFGDASFEISKAFFAAALDFNRPNLNAAENWKASSSTLQMLLLRDLPSLSEQYIEAAVREMAVNAPANTTEIDGQHLGLTIRYAEYLYDRKAPLTAHTYQHCFPLIDCRPYVFENAAPSEHMESKMIKAAAWEDRQGTEVQSNLQCPDISELVPKTVTQKK